MRDLHDGQRSVSVGGINDSTWTSVDHICEISKLPDGAFIENVGNNNVSSDGRVGFVDWDVPGEDETPSFATPIPAHPHACSV